MGGKTLRSIEFLIAKQTNKQTNKVKQVKQGPLKKD